MPELTLHFESAQGTDIDAAAAELQRNIAQVDGVESAETTPQRFQSIGPTEILAIISIATTVAQNTTTLLKALGELNAAWQKVKAMFPGVHSPTVEVGLKKIPIDQINVEHFQELTGE